MGYYVPSCPIKHCARAEQLSHCGCIFVLLRKLFASGMLQNFVTAALDI